MSPETIQSQIEASLREYDARWERAVRFDDAVSAETGGDFNCRARTGEEEFHASLLRRVVGAKSPNFNPHD